MEEAAGEHHQVRLWWASAKGRRRLQLMRFVGTVETRSPSYTGAMRYRARGGLGDVALIGVGDARSYNSEFMLK